MTTYTLTGLTDDQMDLLRNLVSDALIDLQYGRAGDDDDYQPLLDLQAKLYED